MSIRALAASAALLACALGAPAQAQDPEFLLSKQLVSPAAGSTVPPGTAVRYRLTYRCNGLAATTCGSLAVVDLLPPQLEVVGCDFPNFTVTACAPGSSTITANRAVLNAGTTGEAFIDMRVRPGAAPATGVVNTAEGTISLPSTSPPQLMPVVAVSPPINIAAGSQRNYSIAKVRVDPIGSLVISDQPTFVTDRVQFCANSGIDLLELGGATIYDDVPAIATNIRTLRPGGTPPIGETIVGNRVTWTIPPERLDIDALYPPGSNLGAPSCLTFFVTYDLPAGAAIAPDRAHVRTTDPAYCSAAGLGVPPIGDTANPQCFGATSGVRGPSQAILSPFGKTGNDATPSDTPNDSGIGRINWGLSGGFSSNVGLRDLSFYDILPVPETGPGGTTLPRLAVTAFVPGNWASGAPLYDVVADIYVTTVDPAPEDDCGGAGWVALGTGLAGGNATTFTTGMAGATGLCWSFRNAAPGGVANEVPRDFRFTGQPRVTQAVPGSILPPPLPDALEPDNCFRARWTPAAAAPQTQRLCSTHRIERPRPGVNPVKGIQSAPSPLRPLDTIVFRVGVDHAVGDSTGDIVDPVIVDVLPVQLQYLSFSVVQPGAPVPVVTTVPNFRGVPDQTLVRIAYTGTFPRTAAQMPRIDITTRVRAFTADGTYTNRLSVFENGVPPRTCAGAEVADTEDRDGDGNTTELRCDRDASFTIAQAAVLDGSKWISGSGPFVDPADPLVDDPTEPPAVAPADCPTFSQEFGAGTGDLFTRFPCVARTRGYGDANGGRATWRIRVQNAGNVAYDNYVLYDVLPFVGDRGVGEPLATQPRNSDYPPQLLGAPTLVPALTSLSLQGAGVFSIAYSGSTNPCRPELSSDDDTSGWQGACTNDWAATPPGGSFANVRAIRIRAFVDPDGSVPINWGVGDVAVFEVPLEVPATLPRIAPSVVGSTSVFNVGWGSFAHRAYRAVTGAMLDPINLLPTAEPPKVGVSTPERYRLGNLVWRDVNDNGTSQIGEPGINGVAVRLCRDDDGVAGPSAGDATVASTTSARIGSQDGKYLFEVLERRTDYYVAIAAGQAALAGLQVSAFNGTAPGNNVDNDNNAQAAAAPAACGGGAAIVSAAFDLGTPSNGEPTNETIRSGSGTDDDPNNGAPGEPWPDGMSNYSVDFGFSATGSTEDDLGDLPDGGAGTGAGNYRTLLVDNGPSHVRVPGLTIGTAWDSELAGQPNAAADGDDASPAAIDDEDGVGTPAQLRFFRGQPGLLDVRVVNTTATAGRLCGFLDLNADGDFADAGEVAPAVPVPASGPAGGTVLQGNFGTIPFGGLNIDPTYVRVRLSNTDTGACTAAFADGPSASGEVEDYRGAVVAEDRGDLPDGIAGVPSYATLNASGGAMHVMSSANAFLGARVDPEPQGQPALGADGDDLAPGGQPDDEDGLAFPTAIVAGRARGFIATAGAAGRLNCWFDYNANGVLGDVVGGQPEHFANELVVNAGANTVALTPPFAIARGSYYLRCRLTTGSGQGNTPAGTAPNGEVEDYLVRITQPDLGDLPDSGPGVGAGNYETLRAAGGAEHPIFDAPGAVLRLGAAIDAEPDGQPGAGADGDDLAGDDEDGITVADLTMVAATPATVRFSATNSLAMPARVCGFVDFDGDGDLSDAGESAQAVVPAGSNGLAGTLSFTVPATAVRNTFARFRISTAATCAPNGLAPDGEVEDYRATIIAYDLGDLPNGSGPALYPTLRASGGPRHEIVPGLRLGAAVDAEADGQPAAAANGDDLAGPAADDEDGVTFDALNLGSPGRANVTVLNSTGASATLCVLVDWNNDGDFTDTFTITTPGGGTTSETVPLPVSSAPAAQSLVVQLGIVPPPGTVGVPPPGAVLQPSARVRLSNTPGFTCTAGDPPAAASPTGEVEDYRVGSTTGTGLMSLGDLVWEDRNNNCLQDAGEPGAAGVVVSLFRDNNNDNLPDGPAVATQNTSAAGAFLFTNLVPDNYRVSIARPARYIGATGSLPYTGSGPCEPAADPDVDATNGRDKGTGAGTGVTEIFARSVTLDPKAEPDDATNGYWRVDFGLVPNFDLALSKDLAVGQPVLVALGSRVNYQITVSNEGTIAATAIGIVDRIPFGMTLDDAAWTAGAGATATRTIAGPLAPGTSTSVTLTLRVVNNAVPTFVNRAEIRDARDDGGNPVTDIDSIPNDDVDGQDDLDTANVEQAVSIPAGGAGTWLLLGLLLLAGGLSAARRYGRV